MVVANEDHTSRTHEWRAGKHHPGMSGGDASATSGAAVNLTVQRQILFFVFLRGKSAFYLAAASI